jgi:branched-chain amino acid transport system permease protein
MVRHTEYWRLLLGVSIILLVLIFPMGIAGAFQRRERAA